MSESTFTGTVLSLGHTGAHVQYSLGGHGRYREAVASLPAARARPINLRIGDVVEIRLDPFNPSGARVLRRISQGA